jgi:hypothetical protein
LSVARKRETPRNHVHGTAMRADRCAVKPGGVFSPTMAYIDGTIESPTDLCWIMMLSSCHCLYPYTLESCMFSTEFGQNEFQTADCVTSSPIHPPPRHLSIHHHPFSRQHLHYPPPHSALHPPPHPLIRPPCLDQALSTIQRCRVR